MITRKKLFKTNNSLEKYFDKNKTLVLSFSGGRTSGYLKKELLKYKNEFKDIVVAFANTGQEHEKTLKFINNCDKNFGFNRPYNDPPHSPIP